MMFSIFFFSLILFFLYHQSNIVVIFTIYRGNDGGIVFFGDAGAGNCMFDAGTLNGNDDCSYNSECGSGTCMGNAGGKCES